MQPATNRASNTNLPFLPSLASVHTQFVPAPPNTPFKTLASLWWQSQQSGRCLSNVFWVMKIKKETLLQVGRSTMSWHSSVSTVTARYCTTDVRFLEDTSVLLCVIRYRPAPGPTQLPILPHLSPEIKRPESDANCLFPCVQLHHQSGLDVYRHLYFCIVVNRCEMEGWLFAMTSLPIIFSDDWRYHCS